MPYLHPMKEKGINNTTGYVACGKVLCANDTSQSESCLNTIALFKVFFLITCEITLLNYRLVCNALTIFRSPWSNTYEPPLSDGAKPSDYLRDLEISANTAFDSYREL